MSKFFNKIYLYRFLTFLQNTSKNSLSPILIVNTIIIVFQFIYLKLRWTFISAEIPFWYTKPWGLAQLSHKENLFYIPGISTLFVIFGVVFLILLHKAFVTHVYKTVFVITTLCNLLLTFSLLRIIFVSSTPFTPLINPLYVDLFIPFLIAFLGVYLLTPVFIDIYKKYGLITNPRVHTHPGMALKDASARGGGFIFVVVFILVASVFVGFINKQVVGIFLSVLLLALLGLFDDYQNTHPNTQMRILENPALRLLLMISIVSIVVLSGVSIDSVTTLPWGLGNLTLFPHLNDIFTIIWIVWVLNVLSWSNGIDGQYNGVVGVALLILLILALRFVPLEDINVKYATLAAIASGAAFGFTKYVWYPSKIMWGFGAVCAGLILSSLSILISAKITVSVLIILIPFLDAVVSVIRRLLQRKNPLKGDRFHLHHLLMLRGWSVPRVAIFYWSTTILFGSIALFSSEKMLLQLALILVGFVGSIIVVLNVITTRLQQQKQLPES